MNASYMHKPASPDCVHQNVHRVSADVCRVSSVCQHLGNNYEKAAYLQN